MVEVPKGKFNAIVDQMKFVELEFHQGSKALWGPSKFYGAELGDNSVLMGAMAGLRAAALGMVAVAMIQLTPAAIKNKWALLAATAAFVLIAVLKVNTAYVILLFAAIGIAVTFAGSRSSIAAAAADDADSGTKAEGGESE